MVKVDTRCVEMSAENECHTMASELQPLNY
jgi:hypothetical protein